MKIRITHEILHVLVSSLTEMVSDKHFLPIMGMLQTGKSQPITWRGFETLEAFF